MFFVQCNVCNRGGSCGTHLLCDEDRAASIVKIEEGLQVLKVVCGPYFIQGLIGDLLEHLVTGCQLKHELWLQSALNVQVQLRLHWSKLSRSLEHVLNKACYVLRYYCSVRHIMSGIHACRITCLG